MSNRDNNNNCNTNKYGPIASISEKAFPLGDLPIDIIGEQVALYLNKRDIFNFEQSCRAFYVLTNDLAFLETSNYKKFLITNKVLDQLSDGKNCFHKYSKAKSIIFDELEMNSKDISYNINGDYNRDGGIIDRWYKALANHNGTLINQLFKTIETVTFYGENWPWLHLIDKLPFETMFDEKMYLNYRCKLN